MNNISFLTISQPASNRNRNLAAKCTYLITIIMFM